MRYSDQSTARADVVSSRAHSKWTKARDDNAAVETFITDMDEWKSRNTRSADSVKLFRSTVGQEGRTPIAVLYDILKLLHVKNKISIVCTNDCVRIGERGARGGL